MKNDPKEGLAILHLEDNGGDRMLVRELLSREGIHCQIQAVQSKEEFETALRSRDIRLIVSDYTLPSTDGLTALRMARTIQPETPFIFFSGTLGEDLAIESLRQGATDYVLKQRPDRLVTAVRRALRESDERRQLAQAEAALRQREELFRQITENVDDLIAVVDRQGRRVFNSPSYQRILGDPRSLEGKDSFAEIHPEDRANVQRVFHETVATGVGRRVEYRFLLKDGSVRFIESQGSVIRDASDEVSHVVVVSRDVTERRRTEEQMREQAAMLEKAHDA
ncbi:MAG TPA: PAS domain S-box protein, partial [Methylomirabilota bacterium]|nr:PAS domain S-box protein [Methylomirabilota bacterium]